MRKGEPKAADDFGEFPDEKVEDAVQWVWRTKHELADSWKTSTRRNDLWNHFQKFDLERHMGKGCDDSTPRTTWHSDNGNWSSSQR